MKLLLDTHTFLWRAVGSARLSDVAASALDDPANNALVSAASAWEVATKHRIGKLPEGAAIAMGFARTVHELRFTALPITIEHALAAGSFDVDHRDPFDRMLAAQAAIEGAVIVTTDPAFESFGVETLW